MSSKALVVIQNAYCPYFRGQVTFAQELIFYYVKLKTLILFMDNPLNVNVHLVYIANPEGTIDDLIFIIRLN